MALYRFADLSVEMTPQFPTLSERAAAYLVQKEEGATPDITISAIPAPKGASEEEADRFEYSAVGGLFYRRLLSYGGMMLHASAVGYGGRAYLFSAPSGTGKSTHTAGWVRLLGGDAAVINDDKPALRFKDGALYACGTPFSGSSPLNLNVMLPVGGICFLRRGEESEIKKLSPSEATPLLYEGTPRVLNRADGERLLPLILRIAESVPLYGLCCDVSEGAVRLSFETLTGLKAPWLPII